MKAMDEMGFTQPTPIQEQALPLLLGPSHDFIGLASTGTGKTAAFGIPLIEKIDSSLKSTQGLVLSPTRELALQVADQLQKLGKYKNIRVVTIYGGSSYRTQIEGVKRGAHIVVATPGRLVDFLEQKVVQLKDVQTLILDEADEMISMGFKDDLEFILKHTHQDENAGATARAACRTWLFSATMSRDIRRVADTYLDSPETIEVAKTQGMSDLVKQVYYTVKDEHKNEVISRLLQIHDDFHGIIFCQTKMEVIELEEKLQRRGFAVASLHGDKQQKEREITLKKFRTGEAKVLVATDVAARGLDVKDLTHVINHSLPWDVESYIHRIGRTGRNGKEGIAISLINPRQVSSLRRLQTVTRKNLEKGKIPSADEVAMTRLQKFMSQLSGVFTGGRKFQVALQIFEELVAKDESGLLNSAPPELLARVITALHPDLLAEKDYDLDFLKGAPLETRNPRGNREGRTLSGGTRSFDRRDRDSRPVRGGENRDSRPPRRDRFEPSAAAGRPRTSENRERFMASNEVRPRTTSSQERFGQRRERPAFNQEESFPRKDRGPRFDGFEFGDGGVSSTGEKRKPRTDHPGIKRHRSGGAATPSKRRFTDNP
ncbi:MAG: DEAD/DEAH box helicase [Bdellovibrionaceae bacterium]|nr:DEAD/DEAH box helicase [Pseudobdellovibrionaceae bacterium]